MAEGARAGPAPVFRARELTAGTPRRRITNVFKQERLNLSATCGRGCACTEKNGGSDVYDERHSVLHSAFRFCAARAKPCILP